MFTIRESRLGVRVAPESLQNQLCLVSKSGWAGRVAPESLQNLASFGSVYSGFGEVTQESETIYGFR